MKQEASRATRPTPSPPSKPIRPKSVSRDPRVNGVNAITSPPAKTRSRPLLVDKPKQGEVAAATAAAAAVVRTRNSGDSGGSKRRPAADRIVRPVQPRVSNSVVLNKDKLLERLQENESVIRSLKAELDKANGSNNQLQSQNQQLSQDLAAAKAEIDRLTVCKQENEVKPSEAKLDAKSEDPSNDKADVQKTIAGGPSASPPPPPLPPRLPPRSSTIRKPSVVVQFYQSLSKPDGDKRNPPIGNYNKPSVSIAHNSIIGEIQNRSAHLLAVKSDIENKGEFINSLIEKVLTAAYIDIEDVAHFVDWFDGELSSLSDEQAVLKHFNWPEKKADAMREAATEYRSLKVLESELSSYKVDTDIPCAIALKKMTSLLDKSEKSIQRLVKLRNSVITTYQALKIPTDWMLDSGIISKIKKSSAKLANTYIKRIMEELGSVRCAEKGSTQEALLMGGVHFAYRVHNIAGSLEPETLAVIEKMRQDGGRHLRGSQELLS